MFVKKKSQPYLQLELCFSRTHSAHFSLRAHEVLVPQRKDHPERHHLMQHEALNSGCRPQFTQDGTGQNENENGYGLV